MIHLADDTEHSTSKVKACDIQGNPVPQSRQRELT